MASSRRPPDLDLAVLDAPDVMVGLGELSEGTAAEAVVKRRWRGAGRVPVIFPGSHSGPRDLPREFAVMIAGLLSTHSPGTRI